MPRSSSTHPSKASYPIRTYPSQPPALSAPTTGQVIKQSIASGIGSGIGFTAGQRIMSSIFGPTTSTQIVPSSPSMYVPTVTNQKEMEKCLEHMVEQREELPLCFNLVKVESQYREFQSCMKITNNNVNVCKELLPSQ